MRFLSLLALFAGSLSGCASTLRVQTESERPFYHLNHQAHSRSIHIQFVKELK
jgi:hypothetical protein